MSKIDCSKVYVKTSNFSTEDNVFDGAFAAADIEKEELIEKGLVRRLNEGFNGMENPHVFTWSDQIPNKIWAVTSGCATFYNCSLTPNTCMKRYFDEDRFEIYSTREIKKGEELTHKYKSIRWRSVFKDLSKNL